MNKSPSERNTTFQLKRALKAEDECRELQAKITELRAEMAEGVEILDNFIGAVSSGGNYSKEATLVFLGQVRQCLTTNAV